jgi:hypothetical protein
MQSLDLPEVANTKNGNNWKQERTRKGAWSIFFFLGVYRLPSTYNRLIIIKEIQVII